MLGKLQARQTNKGVSKIAMNKILCKILVAAVTIHSTGLLWEMVALGENTTTTLENTQSLDTSAEITEIDQVTSVSALSDLQPTDWAFRALQSLVERYGCIAGYPNGTYRGNQATTRYEFAAGLNTCLEQINQLLSQESGDLVKKEDLVTIERLKAEFAGELVTLRGRLDTLESRTAELEANQFSTTSKLSGSVIIYGADAFGENVGSINNTKLGYQAILGLNTSFTGKDNLAVAMLSANSNEFNTNTKFPQGSLSGKTDETRIIGSNQTNSGLFLAALQYQFPVGDKLRVILNALYRERVLTQTVNALSGGVVSEFSSQNPIANPVPSQSGIGLQWLASEFLTIDFAAGAEAPANDPTIGIFNGGGYYVSVRPVLTFDKLRMSFSFIHSYSPENGVNTGSGSNAAKILGAGPVVANSYLASFNYRLSPTFGLGGTVGYINARALGDGSQGDADVLSYRLNLGIYDWGKKGNLAGLIFGMQPRLTGTSNDALAQAIGLPLGQRSDRNTGFHVEAFYSYQLNDNIAITPGIFWLTAPNHDDRNPDVVVGVIRTSFTF